jgi:hypothetical protein
MKTEHKLPDDKGTKKPHPSPDPTRPGTGKPGTKIPVSPDEDNDFSTPSKEIKEPENPAEAPVKTPDKRSEEQRKSPGPDTVPLPDSPINDPTRKGDPGIIDPTTPQNPALLSTEKIKNTKGIVLGFMLILFLSLQPATAKNTSVDPVAATTEEKAAVQQMMNRLQEIKAMDKSDLKPAERKALRKEVRGIREKMAETSGGIYLSAGALIIIIILLIILV